MPAVQQATPLGHSVLLEYLVWTFRGSNFDLDSVDEQRIRTNLGEEFPKVFKMLYITTCDKPITIHP